MCLGASARCPLWLERVKGRGNILLGKCVLIGPRYLKYECWAILLDNCTIIFKTLKKSQIGWYWYNINVVVLFNTGKIQHLRLEVYFPFILLLLAVPLACFCTFKYYMFYLIMKKEKAVNWIKLVFPFSDDGTNAVFPNLWWMGEFIRASHKQILFFWSWKTPRKFLMELNQPFVK